MMNKEKKHALNEIKRLWNKTEYLLNNRSFALYGSELLNLCKEESKRHDRLRSNSIKRGMTINDESRFFAIQRICQYLYNLEDAPTLKNYHHSQKSGYMAYSLALEFYNELKEIITAKDAEYIYNLDYCELID